jgi:hypothetical protein
MNFMISLLIPCWIRLRYRTDRIAVQIGFDAQRDNPENLERIYAKNVQGGLSIGLAGGAVRRDAIILPVDARYQNPHGDICREGDLFPEGHCRRSP